MMTNLITVVETPGYLNDADYAGMTEADREAVKNEMAKRPQKKHCIGGAIYKVRVARAGHGKSKGWRVLVGYADGRDDVPVYLFAVFAKGDKANLSKDDIDILRKAFAEELL